MSNNYLKRVGMVATGLAVRDGWSGLKRGAAYLSSQKKKGSRSYKAKPYPRPQAVTRSFQSLKHFQSTRNVQSRKLHALYDDVLTDIVQGSDLNDRERQQIFVKGIKLNMWAGVTFPYVDTTNLDTYQTCYLRVVVAINRYRDDDYTVQGADGNDALFKGFNQLSTTGFGDHSNGLNTLTLPINTRKWQVLADFKQELHANANQTQNKMMEKWIPVNKKLTYRNVGGGTGNNPIVLLWWYENPTYTAIGSTPLAPVQDRIVANVYFNDII